jgi:hypothetical protein
VVIANAQPAQPPGMDRPEGRPPWMGWMRGGQDGPRGDRKLTPPDVQKIAEAFLLWRGNHSWKVVEVAPTADGAIGFALATQEGSVIARFTMDPHTARVTRTG